MDNIIILKNASLLLMKICDEQKIVHGANYSISQFTICLHNELDYIYYSCLTGELIVVHDINKAKNYLIRHWFLVNDNLNERDNIRKIQKILRIIGNNKFDGLENFDIITTTSCNASCFYCYEKGYKRQSMSPSTAQKVLNYIVNNNKYGHVNICWFGGEPLMNKGVIDLIAQGLKEHNITLRSSIISNGLLFSEKLVEKAIKLWNLKEARITIDGPEDVYNQIKSNSRNDINLYKIVINNIDSMLKFGIHVVIRINVELYNLNDIQTLLDNLCSRYKGDNITFMISPLINTCLDKEIESKGENKKHLYREIIKIKEGLFESGYQVWTGNLKKASPFFCKAEDIHSIVIKPDGSLAYCLDNFESQSFGNVDNYNQAGNRNRFKVVEHTPWEICNDCPIFASCVHINQCLGCESFKCNDLKKEFMLNDLTLAIKNEYKKFKLINNDFKNKI